MEFDIGSSAVERRSCDVDDLHACFGRSQHHCDLQRRCQLGLQHVNRVDPDSARCCGWVVFNGLNFGNETVGISSAAQSVTVTNNGNIALTIKSITIAGTNQANSSTNTCANPVAANGTCSISVTFTPSVTGTRINNLHRRQCREYSAERYPEGIGGHPVGMVTPSSVAFGDQADGSTSNSQRSRL